MTRKTALLRAISIIQEMTPQPEDGDELIEKLQLCIDELPFSKWSKDAIFDACDQYCEDNNRTYLITADFQKAELPSHPTVKNRFGMTLAEFRDKYYPLPSSRSGRSPYSDKPVEAYNKDFVEFYKNNYGMRGAEYNNKRPNGYPTWNTLAKMNGLKQSWHTLLSAFELKQTVKPKPTVISASKSGVIEYIKKYIQ